MKKEEIIAMMEKAASEGKRVILDGDFTLRVDGEIVARMDTSKKQQGDDKMNAYEKFGEDLQELYFTAIGVKKEV